jgi:hypothetical protein
MVRLTWRGKEIYENGELTFQPGESRHFKSKEDIPAELLMNHAFSVSEVEVDADPVDEDPNERARGTIPRFTEVPLPDDDPE